MFCRRKAAVDLRKVYVLIAVSTFFRDLRGTFAFRLLEPHNVWFPALRVLSSVTVSPRSVTKIRENYLNRKNSVIIPRIT